MKKWHIVIKLSAFEHFFLLLNGPRLVRYNAHNNKYVVTLTLSSLMKISCTDYKRHRTLKKLIVKSEHFNRTVEGLEPYLIEEKV